MYIIYCRKSRLDSSDGIELDKQEELCISYCKDNKLEYIVISEEGSSESWDRKGFQKAISLIKEGKIKGLVMTDSDRIFRDRTLLGVFIKDYLLEYKVYELHTLDTLYDLTDEEDLFMLGLRSQLDEFIIRITKRKLLRGRIQAIKKNHTWFGKRLYGFIKDENKKLIPHKEESLIVKQIFNDYVYNNKSMQSIADELNLLGHKTINNEPFTGRSIGIILENRSYLGERLYELKKETIFIPEAHKPLIDLETFNKAQEIRTQKRHTGGKKKNVYALSQLVRCPICKATLSFEHKYYNKQARREGNKEGRVLCLTACKVVTPIKVKKSPDFQKCTNKSIKFDRLYPKVIEDIKRKVVILEEEINELVSGNIDSTVKAKIEIESLKDRLEQLEVQRKRVQEGFKAGIYTIEESQKEIESLESQKSILKDKIEEQEQTTNTTEIDRKKSILEEIKVFLNGDITNHSEANHRLKKFIETIWYYKDKSDTAKTKAPFEILIVYKE